MAPRLSESKVSGNYTDIRSSDNNDFTHCSSAIAATMARYLALVEEFATVR